MIVGCRRLIGEVDLRATLPAVQAEALVVAHEQGSLLIPAGAGEYIAQRIPDAAYVELDGYASHIWADERIADEIDRFLGAPPEDRAFDDRVLASVLFTDLVDSTPTAARLGDRAWRELLDGHDRMTGDRIGRFRERLIDRTGDGLPATFDGPPRAVRCAEVICREARRLGVEARAGVHVGEVELRGENIGGISVHVAARVMAQAGPGEVVVSRTVKDHTAGSGLAFADRGTHQLEGVPDEWQLYTLAEAAAVAA